MKPFVKDQLAVFPFETREELGRRGCREPGEVFLLLADETGQTFLTKKETGKGAERR